MTESMHAERGERQAGPWAILVAFIGAPSVWALHLGLCYLFHTLGCTGRLPAPRLWLAGLTVAALAAVILLSLGAYRHAGGGVQSTLGGEEEGERSGAGWGGHTRFFAITGALLGAVFALGIVFTAIPLLFLPECR